jgi:hypothetical protein
MNTRVALILCVLAFFGRMVPWANAEDPARFLTVVGWRGTFSQDITFVGNGQLTSGDEVFQVDYSYVHHLNVSGIVFWTQGMFGTSRYWQTDYQQGNAGTIADRHTLQRPRDEALTHTADGGNMAGHFFLQLDAAANQYTLQFPELAVTLAVNGGSAVQTSVSWSEAVTATLPTSGLTLSGSLTVPWDRLDETGHFTYGRFTVVPLVIDNPEQVLRSATMVVTWNLEPILEELEVVVEPQGYNNWMPEGSLESPDQRGNTITVSARLQKKGGGTPSVRAESFQFELVNVSKEPGVCMNFPVRIPSDKPDLRFEEELNQPPPLSANTVTDNQVEIFGFFGLGTAEATVSSFDFGAYGELRVTAHVPGRDPIAGYLQADPQKRTRVPLPSSQPGSHIADAWKERWGISNEPDESDNDDYPEGDGHLGDGFSLYQEYRGFSVNREHVRLKPLRKELFVRNEMGDGVGTSEILMFKTASLLGVHHELREDEIDPFNLMTVNSGHAHSGYPQYGVRLTIRQQKLGYSEAVSLPGLPDEFANSTPASKVRIEIEPDGPGWGLDVDTGQALYHAALGSIAHEIAHCCSVWHHGACDLKDRVWWLDVLENKKYESLSRTNQGGVLIQPVDERGTPFILHGFVDVHVAVPQGQHSGDASCIMCYRVATASGHRNSPARAKLDPLNPPARSRFCTSRDGTGFNAPPRSLFGGAHGTRGICAGQICVNDKYTDHEIHKRAYNCP